MTLEQSIADHRGMYRDELNLKPTQHAVPSDTEPILVNGVYVEVTDSGELGGMPFSMPMTRRLGHPENFGSMFPWSKAWWRLKAECRRTHPFHRASDRPYWRGSLCHQLVAFTVVRGFSIENAAKILRYDNPEPVLRYALTFIEQQIDLSRKKAEQRHREEQGYGPGAVPMPVHEHQPLPGLHAQECPSCKRRNAA